MPAKIQLVYFDLRGRAEATRIMLHAAGQQFEDTRIQMDQWAKVKADTPHGTLPYMVYNGKTYGQSTAINSFFAKELGFYGKTNQDAMRIDEISNLCKDQAENIVKYRWCPDAEEKAKFLKKALEEDMPRFFAYYEKFLQDNGGTGFVVGKSLSLGDITLYDFTQNLLELKEDALSAFPLLQKVRKNVEANPKIKKYLDSRPKTPF